MKQLCEFYIKREEIEANINQNSNGGNSRNDRPQPDLDYSSYYS